MIDLAQKLASASIFKKLPPKELQILADRAVSRKLRAGEFLCHQGDEWAYAVFLLRGELRWAILSVGGREQVLFRITGGQPFLAHSLFDDLPMPASLSAVQASQICLWSAEIINPLMSRYPEMLWEVIRGQVATMRRARELIYGLAFKPVAGRLAKLLLEQASGMEGLPVQRDLTLNEIAATIATSPEVVCRLLYQFQADKIIELDRAHFILNDQNALKALLE